MEKEKVGTYNLWKVALFSALTAIIFAVFTKIIFGDAAHGVFGYSRWLDIVFAPIVLIAFAHSCNLEKEEQDQNSEATNFMFFILTVVGIFGGFLLSIIIFLVILASAILWEFLDIESTPIIAHIKSLQNKLKY